jgi:hypothetical protein
VRNKIPSVGTFKKKNLLRHSKLPLRIRESAAHESSSVTEE